MIDKFCNWITNSIKKKFPDMDEERELIINFGVNMIFGELPKILILFIIGFICNVGWYTVLLFLLLAPYRGFTGGFHLKTHLGCMISTTFIYLAPVLVSKYFTISQDYILYILSTIIGIMSIIFIAKYAPADTENIPIISKKERKRKKIKSYISFAILLLVILLVPNKVISYMFIYGIFLQNLTLMPIAYKLTNCKYGCEEYSKENA